MMRSLRLFSVGILAGLLAMSAAADDKDFLRPRADSVPPNLLIVFGNSQTLTQPISFTGANFSTFDGDGDSRSSKMGSAKRVIQQFVQDFHTDYNIGLTTFSHNPNAGSITVSRKHWVYVAVGTVGTGTGGLGKVDYPGDEFAEPVGTPERWGTTGTGGPCTTLTQPQCSNLFPYINLTVGGNSGATVVGPFFGPKGDGDAYIYLNGGSPSDATERIHLKMAPGEGEYGDGYVDGTLTAFLRGTYSVKVLKTYQKRLNRNVDWPTGASETPAKNPGAVEVLYRPLGAPVPPAADTDPADPTLFYGVGKKDAAGNAIGGQSVGFLNDPQADFSVNANCSGWEFQTNSDQVPLVKIPRDYYWGQACSAPQDSVACVRRMLRPQAYIETYDPVGDTFATHDPDNPGYTTGPSSEKYLDQCDPNLLGAVQTGLDIVENNVILTTRNGSQAPIKNLLDNILAYFSDPKHDGFKNGARLDDPNAQCRNSAVILIYDNFNGCQNDNCNQLKIFNLNALKALGIPVYVIGFGASAATGVCAGDPTNLTEACPLYCIPANTDAFQADKTTVGYFPVTTAVELYNALSTIADLVNESQKGFASSTVATAQANGEQLAFLATFNAQNNRSIWNGRINAYKLTDSGSILQGQRTIRDAQDPNNRVTLPAPSNDPLTSLMWNAGENLADTPGFGATDSSARLQPGAARSTSTYLDSSNDGTPKSVPTSFYPGRKIVFSLPASYPDPTQQTTRLPLQSLNETVPENRFDMISPPGTPPFTTPPEWVALRALLSPQPVPPVTTSTGGTSPHEVAPPITDEDAVKSIRFIWGDRDAIILAARPKASATALYAATAADRAAGKGLKMGDIFHSSPLLVGPPANFAYFTQNLHDYQAFRTTYQQRRRVLAFGANDGLLHVVDAGAWDRNRDTCDFEADGVTRKHCFDVGTGAELFAYAPRAIMQIFKPLKDTIGLQTRRMEWTVDGPVTGGDVFIDANHSAAPVASARAWHTVLIGGMREGSPFEGTSGADPADSQGSYYALDITQPDALGSDSNGKPITKIPGNYNAPQCLNSDGDTTCGHDASDQAVRNAQPPRAWPTVLWEIADVGDEDAAGTPGDTFVDMGETWSKPALGRVKVCTSDCGTQTPVNEDHYVAIFGGGFDRERMNRRGNWLYMVDVETGKVLYRTNSGCADGTSAGCSPVYFASVPSEPAAVDGNGDGLIDELYVGDLKGRMWRIDTTDLRLDSSKTARWENKIDLDAGTGKPFLLFEAPQPTTGIHPFYPIYYRPTIISLGYNVGGKPAVGVGFGTGDRDDITGNLEPTGLTYKQRFYYVVDRNNSTTLREGAADFLDITLTTAPSVTTAPISGWFLELPLGERVNADLLTVGGVIYFTTFNPLAAGNPANPCAQNSPDCGLANGTARLYRVNYATGNPYLGADRGQTQQYGGFLSEPVYFQALDQTGNIIYTTENTVKTEPAPGGKKTSVKSWKERSRRP